MEDNDASEAMQAYLTLLKNKGASSRDLNLRKHFLRFLISELKNKPFNGDAFREAVDSILNGFPDQADLLVLPICAREFYYFWIGDIKQVALLHASGGLDPNPVVIATEGGLVDMLSLMDSSGWEDSHIPCLDLYLETLRNSGASDAVIDVRERLLRLLLFVTRDFEQNARVYRAGVDALQALFKKEEARQTFVTVAREFFYYWIERIQRPVASE